MPIIKNLQDENACIIKDKTSIRVQLDCLKVIKNKEVTGKLRNRIEAFNPYLSQFFDLIIEQQKVYEKELLEADEDTIIDIGAEPWLAFDRLDRWKIDDQIPSWIAQMSLLEAVKGASGAGILLSEPEQPETNNESSQGFSGAEGFGEDFDNIDLDDISNEIESMDLDKIMEDCQ